MKIRIASAVITAFLCLTSHAMVFADQGISTGDLDVLRSIITGVIQGEAKYETKKEHDLFWAIIQKNGGLSNVEIKRQKDNAILSNAYIQFFYQDALSSYNQGTVVYSDNQVAMEKVLLDEGIIGSTEVERNNSVIRSIAKHQTITDGRQRITFTKLLLEAAYKNAKSSLRRLEALYTP